MKLTKDKQKQLKLLSIALISIILLSLFLVGTFLDKQIAQKVGNPGSFYGEFFDWFGKIVYSFPLFIGVVLIIKSLNIHFIKKINKIYEYFIYFVFWAIIIAIFLVDGLTKTLDNSTIICLVLNVALFSLLFIGTVVYVDTDPNWILEDRRIIRNVILMLLFIVIVNVSVVILKEIFARPRPRDIFLANASQEYRPWWNIRYTGKNKSFPSGHTALASTMLGLTLLFDKEQEKAKYITFSLVGWGCIILVATSRMVATAHFLTDVVAATSIAFGTLIGISSLRNKDCIFKCFKIPSNKGTND